MALTLNAGAKWQGDDNMIKGMEGIRGAIVPRLAVIHDQTPEVDEQLHMVLEQVLNGVSELQNGPDQRAGAAKKEA